MSKIIKCFDEFSRRQFINRAECKEIYFLFFVVLFFYWFFEPFSLPIFLHFRRTFAIDNACGPLFVTLIWFDVECSLSAAKVQPTVL